MELTAVLTATEEGGHVALTPETATTSQGEAVEGAIASLTEPTALYLVPDRNTIKHILINML
jgi:predicted RNase H-like HicB family nuclease